MRRRAAPRPGGAEPPSAHPARPKAEGAAPPPSARCCRGRPAALFRPAEAHVGPSARRRYAGCRGAGERGRYVPLSPPFPARSRLGRGRPPSCPPVPWGCAAASVTEGREPSSLLLPCCLPGPGGPPALRNAGAKPCPANAFHPIALVSDNASLCSLYFVFSL